MNGKERITMRVMWKIIQKEESRKNYPVFSFSSGDLEDDIIYLIST